MEHRQSKFLFFFELLGTLVVVGTVLVAFGRLQEVTVDTRDSQKDTMQRLSRIEINQRESFDEHKMLRMVDSTTLMSVRLLLDEVRLLKKRETRIEWKLKLPPIELEINRGFSLNKRKEAAQTERMRQ